MAGSAVEPPSEDVLLQPVLGLMDHLSEYMVKSLRRKTIKTYSVRIPVTDVYALLEAVERVRPGLLDDYERLRTEED